MGKILSSGLSVFGSGNIIGTQPQGANVRSLWENLFACKDCGVVLVIKKEESTTEEVLGRITTTRDRIHNCPICKENKTFEKVYSRFDNGSLRS